MISMDYIVNQTRDIRGLDFEVERASYAQQPFDFDKKWTEKKVKRNYPRKTSTTIQEHRKQQQKSNNLQNQVQNQYYCKGNKRKKDKYIIKTPTTTTETDTCTSTTSISIPSSTSTEEVAALPRAQLWCFDPECHYIAPPPQFLDSCPEDITYYENESNSNLYQNMNMNHTHHHNQQPKTTVYTLNLGNPVNVVPYPPPLPPGVISSNNGNNGNNGKKLEHFSSVFTITNDDQLNKRGRSRSASGGCIAGIGKRSRTASGSSTVRTDLMTANNNNSRNGRISHLQLQHQQQQQQQPQQHYYAQPVFSNNNPPHLQTQPTQQTHSITNSNHVCPSCNCSVPANNSNSNKQLEPIHEMPSALKGSDQRLWNNFQANQPREYAYNNFGGMFTGFTLNGPNDGAKKHRFSKFCSSHKIALVVSTFSLLVTIGLIITLLLMKKRGMMDQT